MKLDDVVYIGCDYSLGDSKTHYKEISGYAEIMKRYGMPDIPSIWGMEYFYESNLDAENFIRTSLSGNRYKLNNVGLNDAIILCCPNTFDQSVLYSAVVRELKSVNCRPGLLLPISFLGCTGALAGAELALSLLKRFDSVTVITSEVLENSSERMTNFAIYSDFVGVLRLSREKKSPYRVCAASNKVIAEDIESDGVVAYDKANFENFESLGIESVDVKKVFGMNLFKPVASAAYKKLGFSHSQFSLENTSTYAHCGGIDPFIGLVESEVEFDAGDMLVLNCQGNGRSSILQIQYTM